MATQTIRPNSTVVAFDVTRTGGATIEGVLSDSSDATWMQYFGTTPAYIEVGLGDLTPLASNERIVGVRAAGRWDTGAGGPDFTIFLRASDGLAPGDHYADQRLALATSVGPYKLTTLTGLTWTETLVNGTTLYAIDYAGNPSMPRVTEFYVEVLTNLSPTATPTTPTGTITNTDKPAIAFTYADTELDAQTQYDIKVFDSTTYGAGGFSADTSTAAFATGPVASSSTSVAITTSLTNGTTYKVYARVADQYGFGVWTAGPAFTIAIDPPATPTLVATQDNANSRIVLTLQGRDNMLSTNQASLETDTTGWAALANCTITRSATFAANGSNSLRLSSTAGGNMTAQTPTGTLGIAVAPNIAYEFLTNSRAGASARSVNIGCKWFKSDGTASATPTSTGSDVTNATANFNTQAVLAVTSPADAAFVAIVVTVKSTGAGAELHYFDKISLAPGTSTTWTRGGLLPTQTVVIQRSTDGVTWANFTRPNMVSPATNVNATISLPATTQLGVGYDYETVRGTLYHYRAIVSATDAGFALSSPATAATSASVALVNGCGWNLKVPGNPALNYLNVPLEFDAPAFLNRTRREQAGFFDPIGRTRSVKIADTILGDEFPLSITCTTTAIRTAVMAILNSQLTALLQDPAGRQWYVAFGPSVTQRDLLWSGQFYTGIDFTCIEVDAP